MKTKIVVMIWLLVPSVIVAGCASGVKQPTEPPPHAHLLPFTQVLGEYHLRLVVDHSDKEMTLVFEDMSEKPVRPVRFQTINATVVLPDGTEKKAVFRAVDQSVHAHATHRSPHPVLRFQKFGIFTAKAEWLEATPKFTLDVVVPIEGQDHRLTFNYEAPGGKIPYHRR
jgi:hypothetical protein